MVIMLKWSKTMKTNNQIKLIAVPRIPNSTICPVVAIKNLLDLTPKGSNLPLFQFKLAKEWIPLTDNRVRRHFPLIFAIQVPPLLLTMMLLSRIFRSMAPGRRTVCEGTLLIL